MASNLVQRVLVAIVGVPVVLGLTYAPHHAWFWGLVACASAISMSEIFAMLLPDRGDRVAATATGVATISVFYWISPALAHALGIIPLSLYLLFRLGELPGIAARWAAALAGILYGGVLLSFLALLRRDFGPDWVLLVFVIAWMGDTGAYFAGRLLGRSKLYPAVSPGKTWAGAWGGLVCSTVAVIAVGITRFDGQLSWLELFVIGVPAAALGQMGDLVESLLKRSTGRKDSGRILAGHGGMLDRFDAVLFIAPYVYAVHTAFVALA